jgi:peroxiredoxin
MKQRSFAVVTLILACALAGASEVGERFPDFVLKNLSGREVSWKTFQGKIVVVNLWMTTCPPCRKEMPMLQQLQNKYASRGVVVVGISADEKARRAAKFARQLKISYPLLLDSMLMTSESEQKKFGFLGLPTTFIVDRNGVVRKKVIGFTYQEDLESALSDILRWCSLAVKGIQRNVVYDYEGRAPLSQRERWGW